MNIERKENFRRDLRITQKTIVGQFEAAEMSSDPNGLLAESYSHSFERAALWLQTMNVKNYAAEDWIELPSETQVELKYLVDEFTAIADRSDPQTCPSRADSDTAKPIYVRICEIVLPAAELTEQDPKA